MSVLRYTVCLVLFATVMFGLGRWSVAPEVRTQVVTVVKLVPQAATPVPSSTTSVPKEVPVEQPAPAPKPTKQVRRNVHPEPIVLEETLASNTPGF